MGDGVGYNVYRVVYTIQPKQFGFKPVIFIYSKTSLRGGLGCDFSVDPLISADMDIKMFT